MQRVTDPTVKRGIPTTGPRARDTLGGFYATAGLVLDEISATAVTGHIDLSADHHTPWGIVHGGVYTSAIETAASVGASTAVRERGMVAVGLVNTTHFLRSLDSGRVVVRATALNQGRTQQLWSVDVATPEGKLGAHGEVRLQNVDA
jgi:1,4-dihydroxy-2-naphthoyl-CoA hydrolase